MYQPSPEGVKPDREEMKQRPVRPEAEPSLDWSVEGIGSQGPDGVLVSSKGFRGGLGWDGERAPYTTAAATFL